jgi:hypothetical protein
MHNDISSNEELETYGRRNTSDNSLIRHVGINVQVLVGFSSCTADVEGFR